MSKLLKKPDTWKKFTFAEKLKWYAKRDIHRKNIYADKFEIKNIIEELNLDGLMYAKLVTHVLPIEQNHNLNILVPVERQLKSREFHLTQDKIDSIISKMDTPEALWHYLKDKYDIIPKTDDMKVCSSYVYKINLGWNTMIFVTNNKIVKIVAGIKNFEPILKNFFTWKKYAKQHYVKKIPLKFFAEEFIGYNMAVYEIYCIYGKPRVLSVYYETDVAYESNFIINMSGDDGEEEDSNNTFFIKRFVNSQLIPNSQPLQQHIDETVVKKMCDYTTVFAENFDFIRVDFYYTKKNIYFSECTFKPGALKKMTWGNIGKLLSSYWGHSP